MLGASGGSYQPSSHQSEFATAINELATGNMNPPDAVIKAFGYAHFLGALQPMLMHTITDLEGTLKIEVVTLKLCSFEYVWGFPPTAKACPRCREFKHDPVYVERSKAESHLPWNEVSEVMLRCKRHNPPHKGGWVLRPEGVIAVKGTNLVWHEQPLDVPDLWEVRDVPTRQRQRKRKRRISDDLSRLEL